MNNIITYKRTYARYVQLYISDKCILHTGNMESYSLVEYPQKNVA